MMTARIVWAVAVCALCAAVAGNRLALRAAGRPPAADAVVSAAVRTAKAEHKVVLIEFGASWCTWCKSFDAFVHAPEISPIIAHNYVVVNITVQERGDKKPLDNPGGDGAMAAWGGGQSGLPFYVFLDQERRKLADSNAMPDGTNVGFPGNAQEVQVFLGLLDRTAPSMGAEDRLKIVNHLDRVVKQTS